MTAYPSHQPIPLYIGKKIYAIEQAWFEAGNDSYALMQQASWGMANWIYQHLPSLVQSHAHSSVVTIHVWTGAGNNGGDGWCIAQYLYELTHKPNDEPLFDIQVIEVAEPSTQDSQRAKQHGIEAGVSSQAFVAGQHNTFDTHYRPDLIIDALFGIGLSRVPTGEYANAIRGINQAQKSGATVIAVDVPSGLNASTGRVYTNEDDQPIAIHADATLCVLARKLGLHTKSGKDCAGQVIDMPLIPISTVSFVPDAWLLTKPKTLPKRMNDTHKGSFGHVLIVGGNRQTSGQGMGGAVMMSSEACFAVGAGKVTVACHEAFHSSLLSRTPQAMVMTLPKKSNAQEHNDSGEDNTKNNTAENNTSATIKLSDATLDLIASCDVMAIGMGLGRDEHSQAIFQAYLQAGRDAGLDLVIDADGLYHLATLTQENEALLGELKAYATKYTIYFTPHSGEAGRLLNKSARDVEQDRLSAIKTLADKFGGAWLLKGAGSIVVENDNSYVCDVGNAGMATAGMGDVLSGISSGLLAQSALPASCRTLLQAVLMHGQAGDMLAKEVGEYGLDASMMALSLAKRD